MPRIARAIKWYSKGLFPWPVIEIVLVFIFLIQYLAIKNYDVMVFSSVSGMLVIPLYGIVMGLHFIRDSNTTVFELSLMKDLTTIFFGRLLTLTIGFIPIILGNYLLLHIFNMQFLFPSFLVQTVVYLALTMGASLLQDNKTAFITLFSLELLLPTASIVVFANAGNYGKIDSIMSGFMYFFTPIYSSANFQLLELAQNNGLIIATLIAIALIFIWARFFKRLEFRV